MKFIHSFFLSLAIICTVLTDAISMEVEPCMMCDRQRDSLALVAFYNALDGPNWDPLFVWDLSTPIDEWSRITLTSEGCVEFINFTVPPPILLSNPDFRVGLRGTIPPEIGLLSELKILNLTSNFITGPLPGEIGNLTQLESLIISNNSITSIPSSISGLENLVELDLSFNQIGSIPPAISQLTSLRILNLGSNNITGEFPAFFLGIPLITTIILNNNQLTGSIPSLLTQLGRLEFLSLDNNLFSGCYPDGLESKCGVLSTENNPGLPWNGDFEQYCFGTEQMEAPCDDFNPNTLLDEIDEMCNCTGTLFEACRVRDSITLVRIYESTGGGQWTNNWDLSSPIDTWHGVRLDADGCVDGLDLDGVADFENSNSNGNNLSGNFPLSFNNLRKLKVLIIGGNNLVTGPIPPNLSELTELETLVITNQEGITGNIPPELLSLKSLLELDLSNNSLTGNIPFEIENLEFLQILSLANNRFSGSIPPSIGSLRNLVQLDISDNELKGELPAELGDLSNIRILLLNDNFLQGCFPENLRKICNLTSADWGVCNNPPQCQYNFSNLNLPWSGDFAQFCLGEMQLGAPCDDGLAQTEQDSILNNCKCRGRDLPNLPCREGDSLVLVTLFNDSGGENWINTWDLNQSIDLWYGVGLNAEGCVESLQLPNNNLANGFPTIVTNLEKLKILDLSSNSLSGELKGEVRELAQLEILNLSNNNFTGSIPRVYFTLRNLQTLDLSNNQLDDNLADFAAVISSNEFLSTIDMINLSDNAFSGCFPEEFRALCNLDVSFSGNGKLPWTGDFSKFCMGENQQGAPCRDNFETTIQDSISSTQCACVGICTKPYAGRNTDIEICHGEEIDLTPFITGDDNGFFRAQTGNGLEDIGTRLLTQEFYKVGSNIVTYQVNGTEEDCMAADQALFTVNVKQSPYFQFVGDTIVCNDGETTLSVSHNNAVSYEWSNGSNESSQLIDISGDYSLTVTNVGECSASNSVSVEILPTYEIDINGSSSICQDQDYILKVAGEEEYESYAWSTGGTMATTSIDSPGTYRVTTTDSNGCEASTEITVENLDVVNLQFTDVDFICDGESATIGLINTEFESYSWSNGETTSEITVTTPGTYGVTIEDENGCEATATKEINALDPLVISLSGPLAICNDQSYMISVDEGPFDSYAWSTGENNPTLSINTPDQYSVTVTDMNGCTASSSISISEVDGFEIEIDGPERICRNETNELSVATGTYEKYEWSTEGNAAILPIDSAGVYYVTVTDIDGCVASASFMVETYEDPNIDILGPTAICENDEFTLIVNNNSNTPLVDYIWTSGQIDPELTSTEIGTYTVTVTDENNCTAEETRVVNITGDPITKSDRFTIPFDGTSTTIDLTGNDDLSGVEDWSIEIITPPSIGELSQVGAGLYTYTQVEDQPLEVTFTYRICNEICPDQCSEAEALLRLESFLQNCDKETAITPNGDGINDFFVTCVKNLARDYPENTLVVYNRWGQTLYTASPYDNNWNGMSASGRPLPQSTYYYILKLKAGSSFELGGNILLIR